MAKGIFTQGVCLLTKGQTTIQQIKSALSADDFDIVKELPAGQDWRFDGPSLILAFLPEVNGYAAVDVVNQPWPDTMGDPKTDPMTFGTWTLGQFGPLTYPGGLARASQHAWAWEPAKTIAAGHRGFLRIRISYCFGAKENAPIFPRDYDPVAEMLFLSRAVLALFSAPGVICYFNPNGEVLRDRSSFLEVWTACEQEEKPPLELWSNIRFFNLSDTLFLMDTVGNGQLDVQDVEAIFPLAAYDPGDVDYYLRNVTHYLLDLDREIKTGENIDGPGESNLSWTAEVLEEGSILEPPRRILRLYPKANRKEIEAALAAVRRAPAEVKGERWFYARGKEKIGPNTTVEMRALAASGQVQAATMVLKEGEKQWTRAESVKEFGIPAPAPPTGPPVQWYYGKDGKTHGPVSIDVIRKLVREGQLRPTDYLCKQGSQAWVPVRDVAEANKP